ncbi:glycosyltransferase family 2 protein [Butyrivibrio sp. AE2032]|uniref:glycosyltransferase family 2 protein n=1 Tax=Butyrivibrio sp. AE2032 TaxID=1458463 RepID=UPI00054F44B8|nr:glycosyltransferase family A protein [Butyrivibrio sp. AE2032]
MYTDVLVSVIIPAYNSEKYIRECLEATLNQTYTNLEIIIVDDGSSDLTTSICEGYDGTDARIRLYSLAQKGVSATRNYGIKKATGKYIVFFDADDIPDRDIIECYLKAADDWKEKETAFITCGMYYDNIVNKNVDDRISILESQHGYIQGENYLLKRNVASVLAWLKIFNFVTNKLYDVDLIRNNGLRFDESVHIGEDLKFNLDYLDVSKGYIGMINKPLYHYVKRSEDSLSLTYHENDIQDTKDVYRRFLEWEAKQKDVTEDNLLVVKSIFITDWTSRLATKHDYFQKLGKLNTVRRELNREVGCFEFQSMLNDIFRAKKISTIRYLALRTGRFDAFCFLRSIYQLTKG